MHSTYGSTKLTHLPMLWKCQIVSSFVLIPQVSTPIIIRTVRHKSEMTQYLIYSSFSSHNSKTHEYRAYVRIMKCTETSTVIGLCVNNGLCTVVHGGNMTFTHKTQVPWHSREPPILCVGRT